MTIELLDAGGVSVATPTLDLLRTNANAEGPFARRGRIVPFAQVLAGAARTRGRFTAPPSAGGQTWSSPRRTYFALQPGGGVSFLVTDRFGVRVAGDYRMLSEGHDSDNGVLNEFRVLAGATFQWLRRN